MALVQRRLEVAAILQEQAFDDLDAPVERVSGAEAPAPTPTWRSRRFRASSR